MPNRIWKHYCPKLGREIITGKISCDFCYQEGQYVGWGYSMIEAMGQYQWRYGLKPIGTHRSYAVKLFITAHVICEACHGKGLIDIDYGENYRICEVCHGNGWVLAWSEEQFDEVRKQILDRYPNAGVDWWRKNES